jgi:cupin 2 domain-containing protein
MTVGDTARGRLLSARHAPAAGERTELIARVGDATVEQIVSGEVPVPVSYDQPEEELVVVLSGSAALTVDGERVHLEGGDWVLLPAHVPHVLEEVQPGTIWLAVRGPNVRP